MFHARIKQMITHLSDEELFALRKDLEEGSAFQKMLREEITKRTYHHKKYCATCGSELLPEASNYTLLFGPEGFKKRASFCGIDCLEYFLEQLKEMKAKHNTLKQEEA